MLRAIRALLKRRKAERELEQEIAFHIESETAKNIGLGMNAEEAHRRARGAFGSVENAKEAHRDGRGARWIEDFFGDLRYALRQIRRAPVFTSIAILVLAVGIGVNSALVTFVDAVVHPRIGGIERAEELVLVDVFGYGQRGDRYDAAFRRLLEFRDQQKVFSSIGGFFQKSVLAGTGATQEVRSAAFVTGEYFSTVRPRMALGRTPPSEDDRAPSASASALISHEYWRVGFGADSAVIGRTLSINGVPTAIIGVLASDFTPHGARNPGGIAQFWIPVGARSFYFESDSAFWNSQWSNNYVGRLSTGSTLADAAAAVRRFSPVCQTAQSSREACRDERVAHSFVELDAQAARDVRIVGLVLSVLTGLILAIACANLSILLLGRAVGRQREIAVRLSLGAGRRRIIRQLLTESVLLSSLGAAGGVALLMAFRPISRALLTEFHTDLSPNWTTVIASMAIGALTGMAFGMIPALHATRASVATALKEATAGFDRKRARLQRWFVVTEVTISIALVSIMGLFVQAVHRTAVKDPGHTVSPNVLIADIPLFMTKISAQDAAGLMTAARERVASLPGVEEVSISNLTPDEGGFTAHGLIARRAAEGDLVLTQVAMIDEGYFGATGVRVLTGRGISAIDAPGATLSAVVSENLASALWPGKNALGQLLTFARPIDRRVRPPYGDTTMVGLIATVVGVADSVGKSNWNDDPYLVYVSRRQVPIRTAMHVIVKASQAPAIVTPSVIDAIHSIDASIPVGPFASTATRAREGKGEAVQAAWGAVIAGGLSLALACVGLFAVVAFAVAHRAREIGIRVALGATHDQVVRKFFSEGMRVAMIGFVVGVPIAVAFMRIAQSQVMGVPTLEAKPIALVVGVLLAVTAVASWLPARRATRVDPIESLRSE